MKKGVSRSEKASVDRVRSIFGIKPLPEKKKKTCLNCNASFKSDIYRLCDSCRPRDNEPDYSLA